jgi:hypothetical protein
MTVSSIVTKSPAAVGVEDGVRNMPTTVAHLCNPGPNQYASSSVAKAAVSHLEDMTELFPEPAVCTTWRPSFAALNVSSSFLRSFRAAPLPLLSAIMIQLLLTHSSHSIEFGTITGFSHRHQASLA